MNDKLYSQSAYDQAKEAAQQLSERLGTIVAEEADNFIHEFCGTDGYSKENLQNAMRAIRDENLKLCGTGFWAETIHADFADTVAERIEDEE